MDVESGGEQEPREGERHVWVRGGENGERQLSQDELERQGRSEQAGATVVHRSDSMPPLAGSSDGEDGMEGGADGDPDGFLDHGGVSGGVMEGVRVGSEALFDALSGGGGSSSIYHWRTSDSLSLIATGV